MGALRRSRIALAPRPRGWRALALPALVLASGACSSASRADREPTSHGPGIEALAALVEREIPDQEPGGIVLVARGERVLLRRARGLDDVERGSALRAQSVLGIGSLTKSFTAAAVLALVADGQVSLDDDVRAHVPEAPTQGRTVTIEELLTHTSGLGNLIDDDAFETWAREERTLGELLDRLAEQPFHFEPGQGYHYSDSGYHLLAALIERVSGLTYAEFLETRLLRPLGLASTGFLGDPRLAHLEARGYTLDGERVVAPEPLHPSVAHAAGALASSADDLLRWMRAWRVGGVATPELVALAWQPRTLPDGTYVGYGFGWNLCTLDGRRTVEHGGWINGFTAKIVHLPDEDLTAIALVNRDTGAPDAHMLARRMLRVVLYGSPDVPSLELDAAQRAALVGDYRLATGELRSIRERDSHLTSQRGAGEPDPLLALSPTELAFADSEGTLVLCFELGPDGRACALLPTLNCVPLERGLRVPDAR